MANEKVSQLIELSVNELQTNDLFLITDMRVRESKKMELSSLITFLQHSASWDAVHAIYSDSASYVTGFGVDGTVKSASYAVRSDNSGHSNISDNSISASWADRSGRADSASWAPQQIIGDTASYALRAGYSDYAGTAYFLFYNGQPNGTSSWAISSSYAQNTGHVIQSDTSSYLQYSNFPNGTSSYALNAESSSYAQSASFAPFPTSPIKAFAEVTWSNSILLPKLAVQSNISSITYLNQFTGAAHPATYTHAYICSNFGITLTTALPNLNYTVMGNVSQPYDFTERGLITFDSIYANKTLNSFTMSMVTFFDDDYFTNIVNTNYKEAEHTRMVFMVLGA